MQEETEVFSCGGDQRRDLRRPIPPQGFPQGAPLGARHIGSHGFGSVKVRVVCSTCLVVLCRVWYGLSLALSGGRGFDLVWFGLLVRIALGAERSLIAEAAVGPEVPSPQCVGGRCVGYVGRVLLETRLPGVGCVLGWLCSVGTRVRSLGFTCGGGCAGCDCIRCIASCVVALYRAGGLAARVVMGFHCCFGFRMVD